MQWNACDAQTLAAFGRGDFEEAYRQANGLFETALTIPGIDRWPFDLARSSSPTAHGCGAHLGHDGAAGAADRRAGTFERFDS